MKHPKVVVLGAAGQLGRQVVACLAAEGRWSVTGLNRSDLDITDAPAVRAFVNAHRPDWLINCAAITDVDGCQTRPDRADAVNGRAVAHLVEVCAAVDSALVYISTDYVFDGAARRPYVEDDPPHPLGSYARSKWLGEQHARAYPKHLVLRTAWMFGPGGRNFVSTVLRCAQTGTPLRVVHDQVGNPSYAADVAEGLARLMAVNGHGTFHFVNTGVCSWYELACRAVDLAGLGNCVEPISSAQYGSATPRPPYSALDCAQYIHTTGHYPRPWHDALADFVQRGEWR